MTFDNKYYRLVLLITPQKKTTAMEKKIYNSPAFRVIELKYKTVLMVGSNDKPSAPQYGDWMGARSVGGIELEEEDE